MLGYVGVSHNRVQVHNNTMVNPSLLPMGQEGQGLELLVKCSTFDEETLFIPFNDVTPSLPMFKVRAISQTLWKACTEGEQGNGFKKTEGVCTRFTYASDIVVT